MIVQRYFSIQRLTIAILLASVLYSPKIVFSGELGRGFVFTHRKVIEPPELVPGKEVLLVALADYLGKGVDEINSATPLKLISAGRPLVLKDANGVFHKASEIDIAWRKTALESPLKIGRQVIGPFASFESAEKVSNLLKSQGIESDIAHPLEWEVWVSKDLALPREINKHIFEKEYYFEVRPVLIEGVEDIYLKGPISVEAPDGLIWNGGVYGGPFSLRPDAYGSWTLLEHVSLERYLHGVVPYEIGASSPFEALSAQAVLARTWALANRHRFQIDGYHLCSDTQCQVYRDPSQADVNVSNAIKKTTGKILTWDGRPLHAVYHATNGGVMAALEESWSTDSLPYSRTMIDGPPKWRKIFQLPLSNRSVLSSFLSFQKGGYGDQHYLFRWRRTYTKLELKNAIGAWNKDEKITFPQEVRVLSRGPSGRVTSLEINGVNNSFTNVIKLDNIRRVLRKLPSTLFVVDEIQNGLWEFTGGGFGHGAGMSQSGAIDLAGRGWNAEKILLHYYPGATFDSFLP